VEDIGLKLAHQFPWNPAAYVAVGLAHRRRHLSDPHRPSSIVQRRQVAKVRWPALHSLLSRLPPCCQQWCAAGWRSKEGNAAPSWLFRSQA
jgi:hypothetical protein